MTPTEQDNADKQQYRFAHNPLAHRLFHTFRAMVTKKGVDAAITDIAEAQAADRKKHELQARIDELDRLMSSKVLERAWVPELDVYYNDRLAALKAQQELEKYGKA